MLAVMSRQKRRIIFYLLTLIFIVAGPLIVAYAFGYAFNFSTTRFQRTGGIFIKSSTPRLSVFLDGALTKETGILTGSTLLTDIVPGTHLVRLEKIGFRPWSKTLTVASAEVVEMRNILLVPHPISSATSSRDEMISLAPAPAGAKSPILLDGRGRLRSGRGAAARTLIDNVHAYAEAGDTIFFVDKNGFFARYDTITREITTIARPGFFLTDARLRFIIGDKFVAIIDPSGGLFLFDRDADTLAALTGGVKDASFDSEEKKLLIVRERMVSILWLADNTHQQFQKKGVIEQIFSSDSPIREAHWLYQTDSHIVWRDRDGVFVTEIDRRGNANTAELVSGAADEIATFPSLPGAIFYRRGKTIYKIEL